MKQFIKSGLYTSVGTLSLLQGITQVGAVDPKGSFGEGGTDKAITTGKLESSTLEVAIQNYVNWIMTFLYLIAVMYALWGGFQILTANGDEEKVKKGKTILIQAAIGLFVIFIAGTFISFILRILAN